jgi:hypothetical protein
MTPYINRYIKANGANQPAIVLAGLVAAAAAYCAWLGQSNGAHAWYWLAGGLAVIAALIPQSL